MGNGGGGGKGFEDQFCDCFFESLGPCVPAPGVVHHVLALLGGRGDVRHVAVVLAGTKELLVPVRRYQGSVHYQGAGGVGLTAGRKAQGTKKHRRFCQRMDQVQSQIRAEKQHEVSHSRMLDTPIYMWVLNICASHKCNCSHYTSKFAGSRGWSILSDHKMKILNFV